MLNVLFVHAYAITVEGDEEKPAGLEKMGQGVTGAIRFLDGRNVHWLKGGLEEKSWPTSRLALAVWRDFPWRA